MKNKRNNPLYKEERHPKRIGRWLVANFIALPFALLFFYVNVSMWFDVSVPWQAALLGSLLFYIPWCAVLFLFWIRTVVPQYRRSISLIRSFLSYREAAAYLSEEIFLQSPYKELQFSDKWVCIKRMFIPKNIIITIAYTHMGGYPHTNKPVLALILANGKSAIIHMDSADEAKAYLEELNRVLPHVRKLGQTGAFMYFEKERKNRMQECYNEYIHCGGTLTCLINEWGDFQQAMKKKIFSEQ